MKNCRDLELTIYIRSAATPAAAYALNQAENAHNKSVRHQNEMDEKIY